MNVHTYCCACVRVFVCVCVWVCVCCCCNFEQDGLKSIYVCLRSVISGWMDINMYMYLCVSA